MRKIWKCVAVLALMLMQVQGIFAISPTAAVTAQDEQVILDNDLARVGVTAEAKDDVIEWTLDYAKHAPSDASTRAIRFKLASAADGTGTVQRKDGDIGQKAADDDWFREDPAATHDQGKLIVTTDKSVRELHVWTQIDSEQMGVQEVDLLQGEDAKDHVVTAPELPAEDQPGDDVVETDTTVNVQQPELPVSTDQTTEQPATQTENKEEAAKAPEAAKTEDQPAADKEEHTPIAQLLTKGAANRAHARVGKPDANDPFEYEVDGDVSFPKHHTDQHINGSDENVRNYDYTSPDPDDVRPAVSSILSGGNNFTKGYHHYDNKDAAADEQYNVYTKKSVQPTVNENEFKVQLDMIGDAIRSFPKVDIVLVIDKSGSMNDPAIGGITRWRQLQNAVRDFSSNVLGQGDSVKMGLTTFASSAGFLSPHRPYAEIASFDGLSGSSDDEFEGYTTSPSEIIGHRAMTVAPSGGTPTFMGVDAGLNLLYNKNLGARDDAKKILVTLTDGLPTFAPTQAYTGDHDDNGVATSLGHATRTVENGSLLRYRLTSGSYYSGDGQPPNNNDLLTATTTFAAGRYSIPAYKSLSAYAIGLHVQPGDLTNANTMLTALGPAGKFDATETDKLVAILNNIVHNAISQIVDAFLTDPMSQYVDYVADSLQKFGLTYNNEQKTLRVISESEGLPEYAKQAVVTQPSAGNNNQLTVSGLNLSGDKNTQDGFRLEYTVKLKEEYRDGKFYPTNGTTTLKNNATGVGDDYLHFAVPSVRNAKEVADLTVTKEWRGSDGALNSDSEYQLREDLYFQLQRKTEGSNDNFTNVDEAKKLPKDAAATDMTLKWVGLPTELRGKALVYRVVETLANDKTFVPGYEQPGYTDPITLTAEDKNNITVTNKLKTIDYNFTKIGDSKEALPNAKFTLTRNGKEFGDQPLVSDENGQVYLENMPLGKYELEEIEAPAGYKLLDEPYRFEVVADANGDLSIKDKLANNELVNERIPFAMKLTKTDKSGENKLESEFTVTRDDEDLGPFQTSKDGPVTLVDTLEPGKYTFKETAAPDGYLRPAGTFTLEVTKDGEIGELEYDLEDLDPEDYKAERIVDENGAVTVNITIKNIKQADGQMPMTGGMGTGIIILVGVLLLALALVLRLIAQRNKRGGASDD